MAFELCLNGGFKERECRTERVCKRSLWFLSMKRTGSQDKLLCYVLYWLLAPVECSPLPDFFHIEVTVNLCPFLYRIHHSGEGGVGIAEHQ